jgi:hypothetical protein
MIDIYSFFKKHQIEIINIISDFDVNTEFSSHDFIEKFSQKFETDYIEMLIKYKNTGTAFQTVHSMLASHLSRNMKIFNINKSQKKASENVHGNIGKIQWWIRLRD